MSDRVYEKGKRRGIRIAGGVSSGRNVRKRIRWAAVDHLRGSQPGVCREGEAQTGGVTPD